MVVGLALLVTSVFPPRTRTSPPSWRPLDRLDENTRDVVGLGIRMALALLALGALVTFL